jgi:small-conductance mechanosensitive channel
MMEFFGVRILGFSEAGLRKIALTILVLVLAFALRSAFRFVAGFGVGTTSRRTLWTRKGIRLAIGLVAALLTLSIWFDDPARLASFMGLFAAGLAFAAQNLVLSIAGYFVIVFGKSFDLGHRIELGGVRGDVLDIGLVKTTIMEMGVPAALFPDPHHWVAARQYTGRVVSVVNAEIFRHPVYNYTANFNLLWEEMRIPLRYGTDLAQAERIVVDAARANTADEVARGREQLEQMRRLYLVEPTDLEPQVFLRLTDNWIELSVRFLVSTHGIREVKDRIVRQILSEFHTAGIDIASQTFELARAPVISVIDHRPG